MYLFIYWLIHRSFISLFLNRKGLQNNTTLSDAISIDFGKDQTAEESKESEALTSITYLKDEGMENICTG